MRRLVSFRQSASVLTGSSDGTSRTWEPIAADPNDGSARAVRTHASRTASRTGERRIAAGYARAVMEL